MTEVLNTSQSECDSYTLYIRPPYPLSTISIIPPVVDLNERRMTTAGTQRTLVFITQL